ncbi:MAG TPA: hypothetical protein VFZ69_05785 [Longimicrobiales bacterium]
MRWAAILLIGTVLVSAWARTVPTALSLAAAAEERRAAERELAATHAALRAAESVHRDRARIDSLLPLLPPAPGVTIALSPLLDRETGDSIRAAAVREMQGIAAPRARVGVFVIDHAYGRRSPARVTAAEQRRLHMGTDSAGAYCMIVGTGFMTPDSVLRARAFGIVAQRRWDAPLPFSGLGPCAFVAAYGAPGAGIAQWLRNGAFRFGDLAAAQSRDTAPVALPLWGWLADEPAIRGCSGGRTELCRTFLLGAGAPDTSGVMFGLPMPYEYRSPARGMLLHDLERQFGPERFARFWTSDADVESAFTAAFAETPVEWVRHWARQRYGAATLGPRLAGVSVLLSVLMLGVLASIAAAVATRRRL